MKKYLLLLGLGLFLSVNVNSQKILLDDSFFNNSNNWTEEKVNYGKSKIYPKRDQYLLVHKKKYRAYTSHIGIDLDESRNFKIQVLMYKKSGSRHIGYGVLWGGLDQNNFYSLLVTGDGYFLYGKVENDKWYNITEKWEKTKAVHHGRKAFNKFTIIKKGNQYSFYINDNIVAKVPYTPFYGNRIGFNVNKKQKVLVEYIKVEYID